MTIDSTQLLNTRIRELEGDYNGLVRKLKDSEDRHRIRDATIENYKSVCDELERILPKDLTGPICDRVATLISYRMNRHNQLEIIRREAGALHSERLEDVVRKLRVHSEQSRAIVEACAAVGVTDASQVPTLALAAARAEDAIAAARAPLALILHCPECGERHVEPDDMANKVHHTHACQFCGAVWRPAVAPTIGVRFLPGFKSVYEGR